MKTKFKRGDIVNSIHHMKPCTVMRVWVSGDPKKYEIRIESRFGGSRATAYESDLELITAASKRGEYILETFDRERVFSTNLSEDNKKIEFVEQCDNEFQLILNKKELKQMIKELTELHKQMKDED